MVKYSMLENSLDKWLSPYLDSFYESFIKEQSINILQVDIDEISNNFLKEGTYTKSKFGYNSNTDSCSINCTNFLNKDSFIK